MYWYFFILEYSPSYIYDNCATISPVNILTYRIPIRIILITGYVVHFQSSYRHICTIFRFSSAQSLYTLSTAKNHLKYNKLEHQI